MLARARSSRNGVITTIFVFRLNVAPLKECTSSRLRHETDYHAAKRSIGR
jgi:hypothetical protein